MNHSLLSFIFLLFLGPSGYAQLATGQWVDHLPYNDVTQILETPNELYAVSGQGFFSYSISNGELARYSKVNGLSDVGVSRLGYEAVSKTLLIGYSNGNLDLMQNGVVTNLPDILNSSVIGDKRINSILLDGNKAWLSCGFGIVVIDIERKEVADSYFIAPGGGNMRVYDILLEPIKVMAATESGILVADRADNLSDFLNWQPLTDFPETGVSVNQIMRFQNKLLAHVEGSSDKIYSYDGVQWTLVGGTLNVLNQEIVVRDTLVLFVNRDYAQVRDVNLFNLQSISAPSFTDLYSYRSGYLSATGEVWLGEQDAGLIRFMDPDDRAIHPDGPYNEKAWQITAGNSQLWIAHGEILPNGDNVYNNDASSALVNGSWIRFKGNSALISDVRDHVEVITDPFNENRAYIGAWFGGLIRVDLPTQNMIVYNESLGNSPISENLINLGKYQVGGFDFDLAGNLWINNSGATEPLKVFQRNGTWNSFSLSPTLSPGTYLGQTIHTDDGMVWIIQPRANGLVVYDYQGTISNSSDDRIKKLSTGENLGGLPTNDVLCIAKDLDGEIWAGTSSGPAVHYSPAGIFNTDPIDFQQILIEQEGVVEILLGNQTITSIAVDGANRKWLGTLSDGVFLLSADGSQQILRFTKDNSPLFSNNIKDIAIDPIRGTVYFATNQGVLGYTSDATAGQIDNECYDVFPNPVRPEYSGPITIDGLARDSRVKITDVTGNLIFQTQSNGGRVVWDGNDFNGRRVSTGVYYALVTSPEAKSTCTSKILLVN
jgi:ligand-binding sensor domain-containing protein